MGSRKVLAVVCALLVMVSGAAIGYSVGHTAIETSKIVSVVSDRTEKLCDFFGSIGTAPIQSNSSKLGVEIVEYSRESYSGLQCPFKLPPASDLLNNLAKKYDVTVVK